MLGRLRMTTEEALEAYHTISSAIFSKRNQKPFYKDGAFKATTLETKIKEMVAKRMLGDRMAEDSDNVALGKAFVCAMPAANMAHPRRFRTYPVRENASYNCLIWEAARATTAAPTFFKPIAIGDKHRAKEDFLDAGLRHNNPADQVIEEARAIFGGDSKLGCLVSIGTGRSEVIGLSKLDGFQKVLPVDLIGVLKGIATDCEEAANELAKYFKNTPHRYFRYSVTHGAGSISLEEWEKMKDVETHTKAYMEEVGVSMSIDTLVKILCRPRDFHMPNITLQSLCKPYIQSNWLYKRHTYILLHYYSSLLGKQGLIAKQVV